MAKAKPKGPTKQQLKKLGARLARARDENRISENEAIRETKLKHETIRRFESGTFDYNNLYLQGQYESYARFLGVSLAELEDSDLRLTRKKQKVAIRKEFRLLNSFVLSRRLVVFFAGGFIVVVATAVFGLTGVFLSPPPLDITSHASVEIISTRSLVIEGRTSRGSEVYIAGVPVLVDPEGSFSERVYVRDGLSLVEVKSINSLGRVAVRELTVIAQPQ